jgi:hypothetical protein
MTDYRTWLWRLRTYVARRVVSLPVVGPPFAHFHNRLFARRFIPDLLQFHDVLEDTDLAGKYWVWAGMLLGWAREGDLLAHDRDADFAILPHDVPLVFKAVPALEQAGFRPLRQFRNHDGQVTEITFRKHGGRFEFFVLEPVDGALRSYAYGGPPRARTEIECLIPDQALVPFEFLGRTWLRHEDHERELERMYGDWRTPQKDWDYLNDDMSVVARRPWTNTDTSWVS